METLKIIYTPFVLEETVKEFSANYPLMYVIAEVEPIEHQRSNVEHWNAKEVFDMVISFADPKNEFLKSIFKTAGIEVIKGALKKAWDGLSKNKPKDTPRSIEIDLSYLDVKATFRLTGKYKNEDIESCCNAFGELASKEQLVSDSKNPRFLKKSFESQGVKYDYNTEKKLWLPHDYEKDRQDMYKRMRDLGH